MSRIKREIFKKTDIAGNREKGELSSEIAKLLGGGIAEFLKINRYDKTVAIGKDGSRSSGEITSELLKGLLESGINVVNLGACLTPVLSFVVNTSDIFSGIMVTEDSLNKEFNRIKLLTRKGVLKEAELQEISELCEIFPEGKVDRERGYLSNVDGNSIYSQEIINLSKEIIENKKIDNLKVVFSLTEDGRERNIIKIIEEILEKTETIYLFENSEEGNFEEGTEPYFASKLQKLQKKVLEEKADLGIAYANGTERIVMVDSRGKVLRGDTLALFAVKEILKENPGAGIVGGVQNSIHYFEKIVELGGKEITASAEPFSLGEVLKKSGALFAGGAGGQMFFADKYYGYEDAVYTMVRFLKIFSELKKQKGKIEINNFLITPEIKIKCEEKLKTRAMAEIREKYLVKKNILFNIPIKNVIFLDGVRIEFENGFILIETKEMEPFLMITIEAEDILSLEQIKEKFLKEIVKGIENLKKQDNITKALSEK
jgi:phosphomannomutase